MPTPSSLIRTKIMELMQDGKPRTMNQIIAATWQYVPFEKALRLLESGRVKNDVMRQQRPERKIPLPREELIRLGRRRYIGRKVHEMRRGGWLIQMSPGVYKKAEGYKMEYEFWPLFKPTVQLSGRDGNAFSIMAFCAEAWQDKARREYGDNYPELWPEARDQWLKIREEMMAGDYSHLLQTALKYFDVE